MEPASSARRTLIPRFEPLQVANPIRRPEPTLAVLFEAALRVVPEVPAVLDRRARLDWEVERSVVDLAPCG